MYLTLNDIVKVFPPRGGSTEVTAVNGISIAIEKGELVNFAVVLRANNQLVGAMGLVINEKHECAELGYWIGKPYWNKGYCTEAARAVLEYGFNQLNLNRIFAHHVKRNPASGRVMQKIGMTHEGSLKQHVKKWGAFEDLEAYAILRSEYTAGQDR